MPHGMTTCIATRFRDPPPWQRRGRLPLAARAESRMDAWTGLASTTARAQCDMYARMMWPSLSRDSINMAQCRASSSSVPGRCEAKAAGSSGATDRAWAILLSRSDALRLMVTAEEGQTPLHRLQPSSHGLLPVPRLEAPTAHHIQVGWKVEEVRSAGFVEDRPQASDPQRRLSARPNRHSRGQASTACLSQSEQ